MDIAERVDSRTASTPWDAGGGWHLNIPDFPVPHGTPAGFAVYGCRCPACQDAWDRSVGRDTHHGGIMNTPDRFLALASREFLSEQNTQDREELLFRARRHAAQLTFRWPKEASDRLVAAFCAEVDRQRPPIRRQASRPITHFPEFDDSLMFGVG